MPTEEERVAVKAEMDKYWPKMPDRIRVDDWWTYEGKPVGTRGGHYVHHIDEANRKRFRILYFGSSGEEASRVVYKTGGIPYTHTDRGWLKGWAMVDNLDEYLVLLPKSAPKRSGPFVRE